MNSDPVVSDPTTSREAESESASPHWELFCILIRWRRFIVGLTILAGALSLPWLLRPTYTSDVTFRPLGGRNLNRSLSQIALSSFGFNLSATERSNLEFYREVMTSRDVLMDLVLDTYELEDGTKVALPDLMEVAPEEPNQEIRRLRTIGKLREAINITIYPLAPLVDLSVTTRWPEISYQIATALLEAADYFNMERQQEYSRLEAEFLVARVDSANLRLLASEDVLQDFRYRNRGGEDYSTLVLEEARLERETDLNAELLMDLVRLYEQARLNSERRLPSLTVVKHPNIPAEPQGGLPRRLFLVMGLVGTASVGFAIAIEWIKRVWNPGNPLVVTIRDTWPRLASSAALRPWFFPG